MHAGHKFPIRRHTELAATKRKIKKLGSDKGVQFVVIVNVMTN